jgi:hypothetical protein
LGGHPAEPLLGGVAMQRLKTGRHPACCRTWHRFHTPATMLGNAGTPMPGVPSQPCIRHTVLQHPPAGLHGGPWQRWNCGTNLHAAGGQLSGCCAASSCSSHVAAACNCGCKLQHHTAGGSGFPGSHQHSGSSFCNGHCASICRTVDTGAPQAQCCLLKFPTGADTPSSAPAATDTGARTGWHWCSQSLQSLPHCPAQGLAGP